MSVFLSAPIIPKYKIWISRSSLNTEEKPTEDNSQSMSGGAVETKPSSDKDSVRLAHSLTDDTQSTGGHEVPFLINFAFAVGNTVEQSSSGNDTRLKRTAPVRAQPTEKEIPGKVSGTVVYYFDIDKESGEYSGTATYNNYCDDDSTVNGEALVSGIINKETDEAESISSPTYKSAFLSLS